MLVGSCALTIAGAALAQTRDFNVPEGELKAALDAYARQSGLQVIYRIEDVHGTRSKGVQGALSVEDALKQLLEGTGLSVERDASGAMAIVRNNASVQAHGTVDNHSAPLAPSQQPISEPLRHGMQNEAYGDELAELDRIVVTGTRLRGPHGELERGAVGTRSV